MKRHGFTLLEVLVVAAIIATIAAILIPSLKLARVQANEVVCRSNLHQIHLGIESYAYMHKGWYPLADFEINPHRKFLDAIHAKKDLMDAMYCPQAFRLEEAARDTVNYPPTGKSTSVIDTPENREIGNISYFYWSFKDRSSWRSTNHKKYAEDMDSFRPRWLRNSGPPIPLQPSDPKTPCELQDYRKGGDGGYWVLSDFFRKKAPFPHFRKHKNGLNVLYLDGHAAWMRGQPRANFK